MILFPVFTSDYTVVDDSNASVLAKFFTSTASIFIVFDAKELIYIAWRHDALIDNYSFVQLMRQYSLYFTPSCYVRLCILCLVVSLQLAIYTGRFIGGLINVKRC